MKNFTLAAALLVTLMGSANAGLLDTVANTATALDAATDNGVATDKALLELVKSKVQDNATKEQVKAKLGAPKSIENVNGNEVWKYDISSISKDANSAMTLASALGANTKKAEKIVSMKFEGDTLKTYEVVDGTLTN